MTKKEMINVCRQYAAEGSSAAAAVLADYKKLSQSQQTKVNLCQLIIHSRYLLRNNMYLVNELDRKFSKALITECYDYVCLDGRAINAKK